jgi:peroxiredoxin Q/BCP
MLAQGQRVQDFEVKTSKGEVMSLAALRGKPLVVFFYPKAFTGGCTIETRRFAQLYPEFQALGAEVIGVSSDSVETQCSFAEETGASFPFVGDTDGKLGDIFGVKPLIIPGYKRVTFVIDEQGVVEHVFKGELSFAGHSEDALAYLKARKKG